MSKSALYYLLGGVVAAPAVGANIDLVSDGNTQALKAVQATVTGTGAVSATVIIEAINNPASGNWLTLATITLTGTTAATDGFTFDAPWSYVRARLTAISGTGASVTASMGV